MDARDLANYRQRWRLVGERDLQRLRAQSAEEKLGTLATLMASVDAMGWREVLDDDDDVRERWRRLRLAALGAEP